MLILALETTTDVCGVAVVDERGTLEVRAFRHRMRLSERLLGEVDSVLREAGTRLEDVEGLGVGIGPGSFTGVRVGVMTAKMWADVLGLPVAGVSSLEAVAAACAPAGLGPGAPGQPTVVAVIRARPGTWYVQRLAPGSAAGEPETLTVELLAERLREEPGRVLLCGEGVPAVREHLVVLLGPAAARVEVAPPEPPRAEVVGRLAGERILAGRSDDPLALAPLYVAPPPINTRGLPGGDAERLARPA